MHKFPNDPIFTQLANLCRIAPGVLIHDHYGIEAGYLDLVGDIIHLCHVLRQELPQEWFDSRGILKPEADPIAAVAFSGYYFVVGFLAVLALRGKYMPLRKLSMNLMHTTRLITGFQPSLVLSRGVHIF